MEIPNFLSVAYGNPLVEFFLRAEIPVYTFFDQDWFDGCKAKDYPS